MLLLLNRFIISAFLFVVLVAQQEIPSRFSLRALASDSTFQLGLSSNIVAEIRLLGDSLTWFGTGQGLALHDGHQIYSHKTTEDSLVDKQLTSFVPVGGIPAIAVDGKKIAVALRLSSRINRTKMAAPAALRNST